MTVDGSTLTSLSQLGCNVRRSSLEVVLARDQDFCFRHFFPLSKTLDSHGKSSKIPLPSADGNQMGFLGRDEHFAKKDGLNAVACSRLGSATVLQDVQERAK